MGGRSSTPSANARGSATEPAPELHEDRAWLDAFRAGDRRALERVFRRYGPLVMTILRRGARSADGSSFAPGLEQADQVEDLLHDIFLEVFKDEARLRYDGLRPYGPFVSQVARHRLFDAARSRGRVQQREAADAASVLASAPAHEDQGPEAVALALETQAQVRAFKASLAPDDAALVRERYEAGRSQQEAAAALRLSRQQIRTRESKIRQRFQAFMKNWRGSSTQREPTDGGQG